MTKLQYEKVENQYSYIVRFNNKSLGHITMLEDGEYTWFSENMDGSCLSAWVLKDLYDKLTELNKPLELSLQHYTVTELAKKVFDIIKLPIYVYHILEDNRYYFLVDYKGADFCKFLSDNDFLDSITELVFKGHNFSPETCRFPIQVTSIKESHINNLTSELLTIIK